MRLPITRLFEGHVALAVPISSRDPRGPGRVSLAVFAQPLGAVCLASADNGHYYQAAALCSFQLVDAVYGAVPFPLRSPWMCNALLMSQRRAVQR